MPRKPMSGIEQQLARWAGEEITPRTPMSRVEKQLARIAGESVTPPAPQSAEEEWLEIIYQQGGDTPTGTIDITENGTYDVTSYAEADVAVPSGGGFDTTGLSGVKFACNTDTSIDLSTLDTSDFTTMKYMFYNCDALTSLDLSGFDTSNVTNMAHMFYYCSGLTGLDISNFDISNVTDMSGMFSYMFNLETLNLGTLDGSSVTSIAAMFSSTEKGPVNTVSNCLDLSSMNFTSLTNLINAFNGYAKTADGLRHINLAGVDTSNVASMMSMFRSTNQLKSVNLQSFTTANCVNMTDMFYLGNLNTAPSEKIVIIWAIDSTTVQPLKTANGFDRYSLNNTRYSNKLSVYVRHSLLSSYKNATNFNRYSGDIYSINDLPQEYQQLYNIDPQDYQ